VRGGIHQYLITGNVKKMIKEHYQWQGCCDLDTSHTFKTSLPQNFDSYILYLLPDPDKKIQPGRRGACKFPILSVKKSTIPDAGWGLFAEREFKVGQTITIYLGDRASYDKIPNNEYSIRNKQNVLIHSRKNMLYLGCHLANDIRYHKEEEKKGRTRNNNAFFHDFMLEACHKIVKGEEIFVGYNF